MKRLTISVLVAGLFAGSLFANDNNTMTQENCAKMYKSMNTESTKSTDKKEPATFTDYEMDTYIYGAG